jgi:hypothetical protein
MPSNNNTSQYTNVNHNQVQAAVMNPNMNGKIMARKPDVYDGETSIDDWVDSMKAYIEGTNPGLVMDRVRVSQIKLFMGPNALRMVKHYLKEEFCDWVALKKCLESVFDRHTLKYSTLLGHFLFREQKSDESFSSFFNLTQNKIPAADISVMLMADHGLVLYGNAVMVNPEFAKANPKVVAGFVRATVKGFIETARNPDEAIKSVMKRNEIADVNVELARLRMALKDNMVTPWVKANGVGGVDMARLAKSIEQIADTYEFKNKPKADDIFNSTFLPPASERKF